MKTIKVENMTSNSGREVANQFIIKTGLNAKIKNRIKRNCVYFQSYNSIIAVECTDNSTGNSETYLDEYYWDYSRTTGKYRNQFLGESIAETREKIASGEYKLVNLN